jgi:hypothetical protein
VRPAGVLADILGSAELGQDELLLRLRDLGRAVQVGPWDFAVDPRGSVRGVGKARGVFLGRAGGVLAGEGVGSQRGFAMLGWGCCS